MPVRALPVMSQGDARDSDDSETAYPVPLLRGVRRCRVCFYTAQTRQAWSGCTGTVVPRVVVGNPGQPAPHGGLPMRHRLR